MKFVFLFLVFVPLSLYANLASEKEAYQKFLKEDFFNEKNYTPAKPGQLPLPTTDFYNRLTRDYTKLRYFVATTIKYRIRYKYRTDKAFALYLESKFKGKELTNEEMNKVTDAISDIIFTDPQRELAGALEPKASDIYFEKNVKRIENLVFK